MLVPGEKVMEGMLGAARMEPDHGPTCGQHGAVSDQHCLSCRDPCQEFPRDSSNSWGFSFLLPCRQYLGAELQERRRKKRAKGNQRNQGFDAFPFEPVGLQNQVVMGEGLRCTSRVLLRMEHAPGSLCPVCIWESQARPPCACCPVLKGRHCPSWQTAG